MSPAKEPESYIAQDMAATGLLFVGYLLSRGMAVVDQETNEPIQARVIEREASRFARGER